jgi:hypothetical protein
MTFVENLLLSVQVRKTLIKQYTSTEVLKIN